MEALRLLYMMKDMAEFLDEVYEGFGSQTKIIGQYSIESEPSEEENLLAGAAAEVNVKDETFSIYISGIDVYGPICF